MTVVSEDFRKCPSASIPRHHFQMARLMQNQRETLTQRQMETTTPGRTEEAPSRCSTGTAGSTASTSEGPSGPSCTAPEARAEARGARTRSRASEAEASRAEARSSTKGVMHLKRGKDESLVKRKQNRTEQLVHESYILDSCSIYIHGKQHHPTGQNSRGLMKDCQTNPQQTELQRLPKRPPAAPRTLKYFLVHTIGQICQKAATESTQLDGKTSKKQDMQIENELASISFDLGLWLHVVFLTYHQVHGMLLANVLRHQAVDLVPCYFDRLQFDPTDLECHNEGK